VRPYLLYSSSLHAAFLVAFLIISLKAPKTAHYYSIDFVAPAAAPAPRKSTALRRKKKSRAKIKAAKAVTAKKTEILLPRKSRFYSKLKKKKAADLSKVMSTSRKPSPAAAQTPGPPSPGGVGMSAVRTDLPNFPFPWYLARVRTNLFVKWAEKNQTLPLECLVSFVIERDGSISKVTSKRSSGNKYFDYDAISAVEESAPFPPLPKALPDSQLRVHVNFKALNL